jgi:hypothetical protein
VKKIFLLLTPPVVIKLFNMRRSIISSRIILQKNRLALKQFSIPFKVMKFEFIPKQNKFDLKWGWWSRIYEYEFVLDSLKNLGIGSDQSVHNTCWGWQGPHYQFKVELEARFKNVTNTDIRYSNLPNTNLYDITKKSPKEWKGAFDFVINVSTIEEINGSHIQVIENLIDMVKVGGFLIATFDYPGLQLSQIEKLFNQSIKKIDNPVTGKSSPYQMKEYEHLMVGCFIIQRLKKV